MKLLPDPVHLTTTTLCALALVLAGQTNAALAATAAPAATEDAVTLRVTPGRDSVYRRGPREVVLELELQARRPEHTSHTPVNVSMVLDRSGSMGGPKIEKARQAACAALDQLEPDDFFSLVIFDDEVELLLAPERAGSREHRERLKDRINRIEPRGDTAIYAGVQMGAKQVHRFLDKEKVNRVVLVSDGLANVGPSRTRDLAELGRNLRGNGVSVTTIGLGEDFNEDLMTALAESSHANYYYVQDAEKLPRILTEEFGAAGTRVAGNIRIRIQAPAGVRLREVLGHPEVHCEERATEIVLPEMFGAEHRLFHVRCELDDSPAESVTFADVALRYDDAASRSARAQDYTAAVRFTDDERRSDESVRDDVAKNVGVLRNRLDKEAAVQLADAGRAKEAAQLLRQRASVNSAAPTKQQFADTSAENAKLEGLAQELTTSGTLQKASRKAAQWDNYQDKYQKKQPGNQ